MPIKTVTLFLVFISFLFNCAPNGEDVSDIVIIPIPSEQLDLDGTFILDRNTGLKFDDDFAVSAGFLKAYISHGCSFSLKGPAAIKRITITKDPSIKNPEGYLLHVTPDQIIIRASEDQGAFYALQSLRQMLPPAFENGSFQGSKVAIPCTKITDEPQFPYRGMHLDVGRHMFPVDFIKSYIDALAMLKMNTFHWHLTEDQGWRIEIKKYPKLQTVAAFRNETLEGHYNDQPHQFDGKRYGGYYTQEEVKEIVAYAAARHITIIPEIEMPGHSQAAIAAYPELGCTGEPVGVATKWGVFEHIYCTKEETFTFLEDVLDEVIALFPGTYIHIGGDEAPKTQWKSCNSCQLRIQQEGLKDEHELQSYFISRMEAYLNSKDRQIIGWDEILEGGLAPNATVMSWRGMESAIKAAKQNHKVIMTPTSHCYFDYYQSDNTNEPLAIGGFLPLEKVYGFNPVPDELNVEEQQYVLGAQGNVWTEYIPTPDKAEYMTFPRAIAMSEVTWSAPENKDYGDFVKRLEYYYKRLDALDINYANHLYEVEGSLENNNGQLQYKLNTLTENKTIRYTLDGSDPDVSSDIYNIPITVDKDKTIKAAVFKDDKQLGEVFTQSLNYHKAVGKAIVLNVEPHKTYNAGGKEALINSVKGSDTRFGDKEWLGFWGDDVEITIDLGENTEVTSVSTRFFVANGQWIYGPASVQVSLTDADGNYVLGGELEQLFQPDTKQTISIEQGYEGISARYVKLKVINYGIIPDGKQGAGHPAWTFIDEIIIR